MIIWTGYATCNISREDDHRHQFYSYAMTLLAIRHPRSLMGFRIPSPRAPNKLRPGPIGPPARRVGISETFGYIKKHAQDRNSHCYRLRSLICSGVGFSGQVLKLRYTTSFRAVLLPSFSRPIRGSEHCIQQKRQEQRMEH